MEYGVGAVEGIKDVEVKSADNWLPGLTVEEKLVVVGGARVHKESSDGDDVFEEAMELALDDGLDEKDINPVFENGALHASNNRESDIDSSMVWGSLSLVDGGIKGNSAVRFSNERDGIKASDELFPVNSDVVSGADVNDYERVPVEELSEVNERVHHQHFGAIEEPHGQGADVEVLVVE